MGDKDFVGVLPLPESNVLDPIQVQLPEKINEIYCGGKVINSQFLKSFLTFS
jgi:uncharacterized protein (DUF697 family)